jgi:hypothetical protein
MNQHIEQAIDNFRRSAARYAKTERYYRGDHDLAFATEKFENAFGTLFREFAMNLCPAICDAVKDKLRIEGFGLGAQATLPASVARDADPASPPGEAMQASSLRSDMDHIWFRNRMQQRAGEIHKEALKSGDAYAVVWYDARGEVTIYPHRAANVTVHYDEDSPGRIAWAAKYWRTADRHTRLNLFFPDRIERYVTKKEFDAVIPDASEFVTLSPRSNVQSPKPDDPNQPWTLDIGSWTLPNPFGIVPVFHFANNSDVGCLGQSELAAAIPIQDGLN